MRKRRKLTPEERARWKRFERESAERLRQLRAHLEWAWADLEEKRRSGYHLEHPAWGPPPERPRG
jgi:hypothetical protein